jgi:hypothetical protein
LEEGERGRLEDGERSVAMCDIRVFLTTDGEIGNLDYQEVQDTNDDYEKSPGS